MTLMDFLLRRSRALHVRRCPPKALRWRGVRPAIYEIGDRRNQHWWFYHSRYGGFLNVGTPSYHPFIDGLSIINHHFWVSPHLRKPPYDWKMNSVRDGMLQGPRHFFWSQAVAGKLTGKPLAWTYPKPWLLCMHYSYVHVCILHVYIYIYIHIY